MRIQIVVGWALFAAACNFTGSGTGGDPIADGGSSSVADGGGGTGPATSGLQILPKKIYTGVDGVAPYRAPVIALGGTNLTWSVADPSMVELTPQEGGTQLMIVALKAGTTSLTVRGDGKSASAELVITQYTPEQRATGEARYGTEQAGDPACSSCHAGFTGPDHTPTLLEVDSDAQVINTFLTGIDPEGHAIPTARHAWNVTEPQKLGLVAYLRSLPPRGFPDPNAL